MRLRSRTTPLILGVLLAAIATPNIARAQLIGGGIVYDPKNFAQAVLLYKRAYDQLLVARNQLQSQATALKKLSDPNWREIGTLMSQIDALTRQGNALAYTLSSFDAEFRRTFPGTATQGDYRLRQALNASQTDRTLATLRDVLNATARSAQTLPAGAIQLRAIKRQMETISGHEQALELGATVGTYSAEELMLLRQQLAAQTNAQTIYYAHQVNDRAQREANERALWAWLTRPAAPAAVISFRPVGQ